MSVQQFPPKRTAGLFVDAATANEYYGTNYTFDTGVYTLSASVGSIRVSFWSGSTEVVTATVTTTASTVSLGQPCSRVVISANTASARLSIAYSGLPLAPGSGLVETFTNSQTYTGTGVGYVLIVGGGSGGGAGNVGGNAGPGGGSGGVVLVGPITFAGTEAIVIGAAGNGGATNGAAGNAGGATSFGNYTANGGSGATAGTTGGGAGGGGGGGGVNSGGASGSASTAPNVVRPTLTTGGGGGGGYSSGTGSAAGAAGAGSGIGTGGSGGNANGPTGPGNNASGYGAGGGGGGARGGIASGVGGNGSPGVVYVVKMTG